MAAYLFQIELPELNEEIIKTIPLHREFVNKLFAEGKLFSYSVSETRDHIWCVINAENEFEAMEIISDLPLQVFFTDVVCFPLLFHNNFPISVASVSLN